MIKGEKQYETTKTYYTHNLNTIYSKQQLYPPCYDINIKNDEE